MTTLSRQDLFNKVWSQPVTKVATELGLSDTAVRKMCDRHDIPVPGRGYWAQVTAGRTFAKPRLRPAKNATLETITFVGAAQPSPEIKAAAEQLKAKARKPEPPRETLAPGEDVAEDALPKGDDDVHPLAVRTRDKVASAKAGQTARVSGKNLFTVSASADQADRVARILTSLLRAMEARGWSAKGDDKGLHLAPDEEPVRFEIAEQVIRKPHHRSEAEIAALTQPLRNHLGRGSNRARNR